MIRSSPSVMWWEFKPSFIRYVSSLDDGQIDSEGEKRLTEDGPRWFRFTADSRTDDTSRPRQLQFRGRLQFTGHRGMLWLALIDPRLEFAGDLGLLHVSDERDDGWETALADLSLDTVENRRTIWCTSLTEVGTDLFMGKYLPGDSVGRLILE